MSPAGGLGVIDVSTDGGRSWSQHHVPSAAVLYGATCASSAVCEVVGTSIRRAGLIVSTTDGGHSWHVQRPPHRSADLDAVSCPNTRTCVAVGDELPGGAVDGVGKEYGLIAVTTDGGRTWTARPDAHAIVLDGVSCSTATRRVVVGFTSNPIQPSTPGIVLTTKNGGTSWLRAGVPAGRYVLRSVSCIETVRCMAAGESGQYPAYQGVLMTSSDGGEKWRQLSAEALSGAPLNDVSCIESSRCVAGGVTTTLQGTLLVGST